jgi:hypothetical protein
MLIIYADMRYQGNFFKSYNWFTARSCFMIGNLCILHSFTHVVRFSIMEKNIFIMTMIRNSQYRTQESGLRGRGGGGQSHLKR